MKTIITSNSRPLHRALCTLLIGVATLWAMPRSARAQLYISQAPGIQLNDGTVGKYDATTGAAIHANFIQGNAPTGLAVSGNNLFLANTFGGSTVGEYDANKGNVINANFITGLNGPIDLAVASVPEPSTWSMIAVGGAALLGIMLRKKHRSA
jgi:hypothetical protein